MFDEKKDLLHRIAEASKAIRQKHRLIKTNKESTSKDLEEFFKPVSEPLKKLAQPKDNAPPPPPPPPPPLRLGPRDYSTPRVASVKTHYKTPQAVSSRKRKYDEMNDARAQLESFKSDDDEDEEYLSFDTSEQHISTQDDSAQQRSTQENSAQQEEEAADVTQDAEDPSTSAETDRTEIPSFIEELVQKMKRKDRDMDTTTGVRNIQKGIYIGDSPINFDGNHFEIQGKTYNATRGLLELLFKKKPNSIICSPSDLDIYKEIIMATNAHKKNYVRRNTMRNDKSDKFVNIISNLVKKSGKGLPKYLMEHKKRRDIDYIYWDDPNELVDRLRLLLSSQAAGNTNHSNEIFSIIEELRESDIIY